MPNEDRQFIKSRLKYSAFTLFWFCNYSSQINLTKNETLSLNNHSNNNHHQKSDKGNSIALLDKDEDPEKMQDILSNNAKFKILQFGHDKELNFVLNLE